MGDKWLVISDKWAVLCLLLLFAGCSSREVVYEEAQEGVPFRIVLDWSNLDPGIEKPRYIKALFFPVDGGAVVERFVSPDGEQVNVPAGEYHVIIYNWRTNAATQTVQFRGDTYDTFEAYVAPRNVTMTTRTGRTLPLLAGPDEQLYGWNTGDETVVISATAPTLPTRDAEGDRLPATMRPVVHTYVVAVHVANDQYLGGISALAIDAHGSAPLGGASSRSERYAVQTKMERGEQIGNTRVYYCRVTTFGLFDDSSKNLILDITNTEGKAQRVEIDITEAVGKIDMGEATTANPPVVIPPETPIVVPQPDTPPGGNGGGFSPPSLGDWDEEDRDIFM